MVLFYAFHGAYPIAWIVTSFYTQIMQIAEVNFMILHLHTTAIANRPVNFRIKH